VKRILIVGAGPTGASLAYLLARQGIDVVLLEQEKTFDRIFRGEGMMPGGIDALHEMGLYEQVESLPHRKLDRWEFYINGRLILRIPEPDRKKKNAIRVLSQSHLIEMLVKESSRFPNFKIELGFKVRDLIVSNDDKVGIEGETSSGSRQIFGDFLIGADGRASIVRTRSGLKLDRSKENLPENYDAMWCSMPLPEWLEQEMVWYGFLGDNYMATMYSSPFYELRVGWMLPKGTRIPFRKMDMLDEVSRIVPEPIRNHIRMNKKLASPPSYFKVLFGRCDFWCCPGILLLGDAAHPMNPQRAQGINLGLRDAIVAANYLIPAIKENVSQEKLLEASQIIQQEREPEINRAQELQLSGNKPPKLFTNRILRTFLLPMLVQIGLPQKMMLRSDRELRYGITPVKLNI
jgi:2-polyprenyl-6-methoxyphenol hydroxylase-like FAD-dependent oxidoreductase